MKCKKPDCPKNAAKLQIYCSRAHAPLGYYGVKQKKGSPPALIESIRRLAEAGFSLREIERQLHVSRYNLIKCGKDHGIAFSHQHHALQGGQK